MSSAGVIILLASAAGALVGAWLLARLIRSRRKTPAEIERLRRLDVNRRGRITTGRIVDLLEPDPSDRGPRLLFYKYELRGVTYEAAQDLSALPEIVSLARYATGGTTSVKYDPRIPTNSIVGCEGWCGIKKGELSVGANPRPAQKPMKTRS